MKSNRDIINTNYRVICQAVLSIGVTTKYASDLKQEVFFELLKQDNKRLNELDNNNKLAAFACGIAKRQYHSNDSKFWRNFKRHGAYKGIDNL